MKAVLDQYVETTLGSETPAETLFCLYEHNYGSVFPDARHSPCLDIGIGIGGMLILLKRLGYTNAKGIDISPSAIRSCRRKGLDCELVENTTEWLNAHVREFELITLLNVIEHIPKGEVIDVLAAIRKSLTTGGVLLIQTNNMQAEYAQIMRYGDITHEVGYCELSLRQVCLAAGFRQVEIHGLEPLYAFRRWRYARRMARKAVQHLVWTMARTVFWCWVRTVRRVNCTYTPPIMHPMFYAVVRE